MNSPAAPPLASAEKQPTDGVASAAPGGRKRKRSTRIALVMILIVTLGAVVAFATSYFFNARNYVSTDNAQIDGDKISVNAPASGILLNWSATQGSPLHKGDVVGRIEMQGAFNKPQMSIRSPGEGAVAVDNGVPGAYVTAGTQLAVAYDLNKIYVTARVEETDVKAVRVGQVVDIDVDAYPNAQITGRVQAIQGGAAAVFSLFPQSNSNGGNFQKVTQVIPIKIGFDNVRNLDLVPGMNVTAHIHKH